MCYSAMIKSKFAEFRRITHAQIDIDEFVRLYHRREEGERITIPRGMDRNFDDPKTPQEREIHKMIVRYDTAQITKLEQEIFTQRKRLADADRKLAEKETKTATESKRIATEKVAKALKKLSVLKDGKERAADRRIFPMHYAPIVVCVEGVSLIKPARYHCRLAGKPASVDNQYPGLYNARRDNIEKYWGAAFGETHALMLVESFYENVDRNGKNAVLHFVPRPEGTMYIACLYSVWRDPKTKDELLSFAAITDEPPPEVAAAGHDRMIINIKPENIDAWLTPKGRSREELQAILSDRQTPYYEHQELAA